MILDLPPLIADVIGFAGMACIILAYAYLTATKSPNPFFLHGTNLAGAMLLTVSLLVHTNLASLVLEGFWAAIAVWGLVKAWQQRFHSRLREGLGVGHTAPTDPPPSPLPQAGVGE